MFSGFAGLRHQHFTERVVAGDEELIPGVEPFQESPGGQTTGLAVCTTIAVSARQDKVPHPVQPQHHVALLERPWEKVVHIGKPFGGILYGDVIKTVEALSLLVPIQRIPATGEIRPPPLPGYYERVIVNINSQSGPGDLQLPRSLDKPPSSLNLLWEVAELESFTQPEQFVGQPNPAPALAVINEEPYRDLAPIDDMKGVDHVIEAQLGRLPNQFILAEFSGREFSARFQKPAGCGRCLLRSLGKMFDNMPGKRLGQLLQLYGLVLAGGKLDEGLR
jgi:hypothetical protein